MLVDDIATTFLFEKTCLSIEATNIYLFEGCLPTNYIITK